MTYYNRCGGLEVDSNLPVMSTNWNLTASSVDVISPIAITFFGNTQDNLPLPLVPGNADPTCSIYINTLIGILTAPAAAGLAVSSFPIPSNPALAGAIVTA
jgi:hypothetical protein